ncbi:hypothetical protein Pan216_37330 [Planctomycetes bacterium Pan216]|uniref:DUF1501 domain-containing protein n=1 Tax=Kolteria novifilia TaxID=2527975 RepID=A0A518B7A6_9BACT|nr:hypothetical protein Pan216_37330 [Planctomycetes bacterium Pan216]
MKRREFVQSTMQAGLAASLLGASPALASHPASHGAMPQGKAEHVIFIWLGGGASQIDTFDPKAKGDAKAKKPGSYYDAIPTAVKGVQVCEHLGKTAKVLDRCTLVRTVHHEVIDEHAAATNRMHTGRPTTGTIVYPSIGSIAAHQRGPANDKVPAYVLIGYPNITRGPGFLGPRAGYVYLTDTEVGPSGFSPPPRITNQRRKQRERLLSRLRSMHRGDIRAEKALADYDATIDEALRLSGPDFQQIFNLGSEPDSIRNSYGGEFGQRCLLARRLVESGVRFVEVSHNLNFVNGTGWDTHNEGQLNQHLLIQELDTALAGLVLDLERRNYLDKTLIVVGTEFGRPAKFDGRGGRGHHSKSFSVFLGGGGLRHCGAYGTTDAMGTKIEEKPVSVADLHATIHASIGIDPSEVLYAGERPVPITDGGKPIAELFG